MKRLSREVSELIEAERQDDIESESDSILILPAEITLSIKSKDDTLDKSETVLTHSCSIEQNISVNSLKQE